MKIVTFNVNSIKMRAGIVRNFLAAHDIDVLGLQELKGLEFPIDDFNAAGYTATVVPQKAYNGVAALSRKDRVVMNPDATLIKLPGMDDDDAARFVSVHITAPIDMTLINIYAPNGNPVGTDKYAYKLRWLNALYDHLVALRRTGRNVAVMGDFNIIPNDDDAARIEDWRGDALAQPEVRALYRAMLYLGFTDALKTKAVASNILPLTCPPKPEGRRGKGGGVAPEGDGGGDRYTFWDYQAGAWQRNNGIRIDHVLVSPGLADRLVAAHVDRAPRDLPQPSDHTPVVVEFV